MNHAQAIKLSKNKLKECTILIDSLLDIKKRQDNCCVYDKRLKEMYEDLIKKKDTIECFLAYLKNVS